MANQRDYLGGDLYDALAAYNAGPGNAQIWQSLPTVTPICSWKRSVMTNPHLYPADCGIHDIYR